MKAKVVKQVLGIFMLAVISFAVIPFASFHHHEHENACDVALNIPLKFKKEKDQSKHHLHTLENKCFVCSNAIIKNCAIIKPDNKKIQQCYIVKYVLHNYFYTFNTVVEFNNKAPPARV